MDSLVDGLACHAPRLWVQLVVDANPIQRTTAISLRPSDDEAARGPQQQDASKLAVSITFRSEQSEDWIIQIDAELAAKSR